MVNLTVPGSSAGVHHALWHKACGKDWDVWYVDVEKIFSINIYLVHSLLDFCEVVDK